MTSHLMDDIAKTLAGPVSRRQTFKLIGGGLAAAVLAALGIRSSFGAGCGSNQTACGFVCCNNDTQVCIGNKCCPKATPKLCNGCCCPADSQCVKSGCCPAPRVVCNGVCCAEGEVCPSGKCVPGNQSLP